jgi:ubiquinone/menaquinone biosynthesis C-methylase UbiE
MIAPLLRLLHGPVYRRRIEVLSSELVGEVGEGERVLDVGCGSGALGMAVLAHGRCPAGLVYEGVEVAPRGDEGFPVAAMEQGGGLPFEDGSFDVVVVADVLHHVPDELALLREVRRVARRAVVVKDHRLGEPLAQARISLIDWAANHGYGVPCLYRYHDLEGWRGLFRAAGMRVEREERSMALYPAGFNLLFGRGLQYLAVVVPDGEVGAVAQVARKGGGRQG